MKSVLILDDDDIVRESLMDFFEDRNWRVISAASAEEALEQLQKAPIQAAVVDIRLPGMGGDEFIYRANKHYPQMVFVIYTGSPEYQPVKEIVSLPNVSDKVFSKPARSLALLEDELTGQIDTVSPPKKEITNDTPSCHNSGH